MNIIPYNNRFPNDIPRATTSPAGALKSGTGRWRGALLRLLLYLLAIAGMVAILAMDAWGALVRQRGVENGLAADLPPLAQPRYAVNVALDRYSDRQALEALETIRALGFRTIRQRFPWADIEPVEGEFRWEKWDGLVSLAQANDLQMIAVLDTSPAWARPSWEADNPLAPPASPEMLARFAAALAGRYGDAILAYQIWDQPNIWPHWGSGAIDPAGYVDLLRHVGQAIREVDPKAHIIAGALAPNTEPGGRNMSDVLFLHEIYRLGAGALFDVLGVYPYGFWSGPDDRRVDPRVLNFSRVILLREEMLRRNEGHKPVWALDGGWCALPANWQGQPSPQGSDVMTVQADRLDRALERIEREWPWMTLVALQHFWPDLPPTDPTWGYALIDPQGKATPLLDAFDRRLTSGPRAFPGHSPEIDRLWLSLNGNRGLAIWGTDVWLGIKAGEGRGTLTVRSEGLRSTDLFRILQSHAQGNIAHIDLDALADVPAGEGRALTWISVAEGLAPGEHLLHVEGGAEQIAAVRALRVGHRPEPWALVRTQLLGVLALILLGARARREAQLVPWRHAWQSIHRKWSAVPVAAQGLLLIGAAGGAFLAPVPTLRLAALTAYGLLALLGADIALLMAVASIPLAPLHVRLGPGSFSVTEVALLIAVAARVGASLLDGRDTGDRRWAKARLGWPDIAVLALVVLGLGTSLLAEYRRVALREFRVVVLESALLYLLVRRSRLSRSSLMALIDALWLSAVVVALYALVGYALGFGVIAAEGVNRARAFYGSPNNLALYLERVLPLGPVLAWRADARRRRWLYGLGTLPMASALMLTFSRGSCLLGLPAALLVLILFQGGKWRWLAPLGLMGGLAALIPLSRTERFASLFDLSRGTLSLRIKLWQAACDMVRDHPWLGVGLDNFLYYYGDYIRPGAEIERWLSHPHNLLLDFWLRLGIGGVIVLLALLAGFWASALKLYRGSASAERRAACLGLMAGMAACLAHGLIDSSYFVTELAHWFLFALAWVGRAGDEETKTG